MNRDAGGERDVADSGGVPGVGVGSGEAQHPRLEGGDQDRHVGPPRAGPELGVLGPAVRAGEGDAALATADGDADPEGFNNVSTTLSKPIPTESSSG